MNGKRTPGKFRKSGAHGRACVVGALVCALSVVCLLALSACAEDEQAQPEEIAGVAILEVDDIPYADVGEMFLTDTQEEDAIEEVQEPAVEEESEQEEEPAQEEPAAEVETVEEAQEAQDASEAQQAQQEENSPAETQEAPAAAANTSGDAASLRAALNISEDYRSSFDHGDKSAQYQKYIVLHDTEGNGDANSVVSYWDGNGSGVAAHFIINKDGSIVQCVPLDRIAHHAGFGDTGHNALYGVAEDGRDDRVGTESIGSWASDYGMNSYSIGIELVHVGGSGAYPEAQLQALDNLIAYIDAYYGGYAGEIIDHKAWRTGNSDTSAEFANYLASYKATRKHA